MQNKEHLGLNLIFSLIVLFIAYFTYFDGYEYPAELIWDEHFYITDAQRYLSGVMFMEMHPPLGKQLIALGEWLFQSNKNIDTSKLLEYEKISSVPENFSFKGVRFFPVLLSSLSALLFFWILYNISRRPLLSFLFSSLYLFDNALIVQSRGAMLDAPQIFFALATLLFFIYRLNKLLEGKENTLIHYLILGILIGLCSAVKYTGLILIILIPFWFFANWKSNKNLLNQSVAKTLLTFFFQSTVTLMGLLLVLFLSFYSHFNLATKVTSNTFKASPHYLKIIVDKKQSDLKNFIPMLVENLLFTQKYNQEVRNYKPCKPGENGSLASNWPFMNKPIRYLAERDDNGKTKYLYLHGNPVIWYSVLLAICIVISLTCSKYFFPGKITIQQPTTNNLQRWLLIGVFSLMYLSYLFVFYSMDRVFYLYHYLLPLCFGLLIFYTLFIEIFDQSLQSGNALFYLAIFLFIAEIVFIYWIFSPLTYYQPLSLESFHQRQWIDSWNLKPLP
jgi:dolichyl-phosphate-mannose-protein mannosyltransferase